MDRRALWFTLTADETLRALASDARSGISDDEAARRLAELGPNELRAPEHVHWSRVLLSQFQNVLILILLGAAVLSAALGHAVEAIAIAAILALAVTLGFVQELRAERAIEKLRAMAAATAHVVRGGREVHVPARELVPGDVVLLAAGARVPADARLLEAPNLQADEASLTGESVPVEKQVAPLPDSALALGDRTNLVFAGTAVTYGRARGVVVATGMETEVGSIARLLESVEEERTPLQQNLDRVGKVLALAAVAVVAVIVAMGLLRGQPILEILVFGIALAVAVVPEALPAVVTISLAIGVQRMVRRHALVRRLAAVETLGSTSVICTDKTGTLTRDEMTVRRLFVCDRELEVTGSGYDPHGELRERGVVVPSTPDVETLLRATILASDARIEVEPGHGRVVVHGDPTEAALVVAGAKVGFERAALESAWPRVDEIPFTSESKRMVTLHAHEGVVVAFCKGAPEAVLDLCERRRTSRGIEPLHAEAREAVLADARRLAGESLRVLAIAEKSPATRADAEQGLTLLGLVGMLDPPRAEVFDAIRSCETAGIRVVMITGDHPVTAEAVAREIGIARGGQVVTGPMLERLSDAELEREVEGIDVFARVSPADKLRVVSALQRRGHVAAMTGDGVNDAPALKKAAIGVAMGITGTDVAKEAAAITLTDDNFASIVAAVEEGRRIYGNIKKYIMYLLSSNIGEIGLVGLAAFVGLPMPLTAVQLLYVNLATDGLPALALAVDPPEPDLMRRPPRDPRLGIFSRGVVALMLVGGVWSMVVNFLLFMWASESGRPAAEATTMTFVSLVLIQLFKAYSFRSDRASTFEHPFANRWLNLAVGWELAMLAAVVYVPALHEPFGTYALSAVDWAIAAGTALTVVPVLDLAKWANRRGLFERRTAGRGV
jgi:Ca2+-transporting ATPase